MVSGTEGQKTRGQKTRGQKTGGHRGTDKDRMDTRKQRTHAQKGSSRCAMPWMGHRDHRDVGRTSILLGAGSVRTHEGTDLRVLGLKTKMDFQRTTGQSVQKHAKTGHFPPKPISKNPPRAGTIRNPRGKIQSRIETRRTASPTDRHHGRLPLHRSSRPPFGTLHGVRTQTPCEPWFA